MRGDASAVVLHGLLGVDVLHADRVAHLALGTHRERVALALLERQHRVGRLQALREENNNRLNCRRLKNAHRTHTKYAIAAAAALVQVKTIAKDCLQQNETFVKYPK